MVGRKWKRLGRVLLFLVILSAYFFCLFLVLFWYVADFIEETWVLKQVTLPCHITDDYHKIRKDWILDTPMVRTFSFSLALLTIMIVLFLHCLSPSSHISFPSPQLLYLPLADFLWKLIPRREDAELRQPHLFFWSLPILGNIGEE